MLSKVCLKLAIVNDYSLHWRKCCQGNVPLATNDLWPFGACARIGALISLKLLLSDDNVLRRSSNNLIAALSVPVH